MARWAHTHACSQAPLTPLHAAAYAAPLAPLTPRDLLVGWRTWFKPTQMGMKMPNFARVGAGVGAGSAAGSDAASFALLVRILSHNLLL